MSDRTDSKARLLLLFLVVRDGLNPLFALLVAAVPVAQRALGLLRAAQGLRGMHGGTGSGPDRTTGRTSRIETRFLSMVLDVETGDMDGVVREGRFRGQRLSGLDLGALRALLEECRAGDAQSVTVLEAYLDRVHGEAWRSPGADGGSRVPSATMSLDEARQVLGIGPGAGREEIVSAHRRLMQRLHPDRGGSTYLAAKINQAKDLLLQELAA